MMGTEMMQMDAFQIASFKMDFNAKMESQPLVYKILMLMYVGMV